LDIADSSCCVGFAADPSFWARLLPAAIIFSVGCPNSSGRRTAARRRIPAK
jgi:hypothetical protein